MVEIRWRRRRRFEGGTYLEGCLLFAHALLLPFSKELDGVGGWVGEQRVHQAAIGQETKVPVVDYFQDGTRGYLGPHVL